MSPKFGDCILISSLNYIVSNKIEQVEHTSTSQWRHAKKRKLIHYVPMTFFLNKAINKNVFQSVTLEILNDPWLRDLLKMEKAMKTLI